MPDLAFSELSFLNFRRKRSEDSPTIHKKGSDKRAQRKSKKATDTEAEISRYFTNSNAAAQGTRHASQSRQDHRQAKAPSYELPGVSVALPDKPFLGFGSCGAHSASPTRKLDSEALKELERRLTKSQTRSTSYLTWSEGDVHSRRSVQSSNNGLTPLESTKFLNRKWRPRSPCESHGYAYLSPHASPQVAETPGRKHVDVRKASKVFSREIASREHFDSGDRQSRRPVKEIDVAGSPDNHQRTKPAGIEESSDARIERQQNADFEIQIPGSIPEHDEGLGSSHEQTAAGGENQPVRDTAVAVPKLNVENQRIDPVDINSETVSQQCLMEGTTEMLRSIRDQPTPGGHRRLDDTVYDSARRLPRMQPQCESRHGYPLKSASKTPNSGERGTQYTASQGQFPPRARRFESKSIQNSQSRQDLLPSRRHQAPSFAKDRSLPSSNMTRDSSSAWTGYENIYQRQEELGHSFIKDNEALGLERHHNHLNGHTDFALGSYYIEDNDRRHDHHDLRGIDIDERRFELDNSSGHYRENTSYAQPRIVDQHESRQEAERLVFDLEEDKLIGNSAEGGYCQMQNHHEPTNPDDYPVMMEETYNFHDPILQSTYHGRPDRCFGTAHLGARTGSAKRSSAADARDHQIEELVPSNFWTPHRLY